MISRRLLRVKVLQVLYADYNKQSQNINQTEKELFFSIQKSYDLYHFILLLPIELVRSNERRIDAGKSKLRPTPEDKSPNTRFSNNKLVTQLKDNLQLKHYVSENKVGWVNYPELIKNLFNQIKEKDYFIQYMNNNIYSYNEDKKIILRILEDEIPYFKELENTLEELSIFWNDDIDFILSMAIKTLKTFKESDGPDKPLMTLFKNEDDKEFVTKLFRKVWSNHNEYNLLIQKQSQNWEFDRIAIMDILIMQMALAEMLEFPSIPVKVSLNEYIEIAKDYSTVNSNIYINGVLDNIVKFLKVENKIVKTGRGLIEGTGEKNLETGHWKKKK